VDHDALKQYFPLGIVLPQMFAIYETLLSLKFVRQEVRPTPAVPLAAPLAAPVPLLPHVAAAA